MTNLASSSNYDVAVSMLRIWRSWGYRAEIEPDIVGRQIVFRIVQITEPRYAEEDRATQEDQAPEGPEDQEAQEEEVSPHLRKVLEGVLQELTTSAQRLRKDARQHRASAQDQEAAALLADQAAARKEAEAREISQMLEGED